MSSKGRRRHVIGVDGCRDGWLYVRRDLHSEGLAAGFVTSFAKLVHLRPQPAVLAIDVPIGLPSAGARDCDHLARSLLGRPRGTSVFPAPIRPALAARSWEEACRVTERADGRRISKQTWAIVRKIGEVDSLLANSPSLQRRVREVHPEVSFFLMNGGKPIRHGKKERAGLRARAQLIGRWLGDVLDGLRAQLPPAGWAYEDLLDACAALWSASRIAEGKAISLPQHPPVDASGLRMEIVA